jgi:hypothetical protein
VDKIDTNISVATALIDACWGEQVALDNTNVRG